MAQTYTEFKQSILDTLWRQNDTDLANNMDRIIRMAEKELERGLTIQRREQSLVIAPEIENYVLPTDFKHIISLVNLQPERQRASGVMLLTNTSNVLTTRAATNSAYIEPLYSPLRGELQTPCFWLGLLALQTPVALPYSIGQVSPITRPTTPRGLRMTTQTSTCTQSLSTRRSSCVKRSECRPMQRMPKQRYRAQ